MRCRSPPRRGRTARARQQSGRAWAHRRRPAYGAGSVVPPGGGSSTVPGDGGGAWVGAGGVVVVVVGAGARAVDVVCVAGAGDACLWTRFRFFAWRAACLTGARFAGFGATGAGATGVTR